MGALFSLGAGCQKWKPLDIPGTQPPLSDAVVKGDIWVYPEIKMSSQAGCLITARNYPLPVSVSMKQLGEYTEYTAT